MPRATLRPLALRSGCFDPAPAGFLLTRTAQHRCGDHHTRLKEERRCLEGRAVPLQSAVEMGGAEMVGERVRQPEEPRQLRAVKR